MALVCVCWFALFVPIMWLTSFENNTTYAFAYIYIYIIRSHIYIYILFVQFLVNHFIATSRRIIPAHLMPCVRWATQAPCGPVTSGDPFPTWSGCCWISHSWRSWGATLERPGWRRWFFWPASCLAQRTWELYVCYVLSFFIVEHIGYEFE